MPSSENTGYLVQLKSPEGENVYPIISAEMIKDKNGETYDLPGLFQSVSEGKSAIAAAVTDKGVTTAADASFEQIAANIGSIQTAGQLDLSQSLYSASHSGGYSTESDQTFTFTIPANVVSSVNLIRVSWGPSSYETYYIIIFPKLGIYFWIVDNTAVGTDENPTDFCHVISSDATDNPYEFGYNSDTGKFSIYTHIYRGASMHFSCF